MREKSVALDSMMPLLKERLAREGAVQFTPNGISMRPMLEGGRDPVILVPLPEKLKKYDLPLYQRENGQYVLHRIVKVGESYTCIGDNQFVAEPGLRREQMIALVSRFVRKGREYSVDSLRYRIYCRFWHFSRPIRHFFRRVLGRIKRLFHQ